MPRTHRDEQLMLFKLPPPRDPRPADIERMIEAGDLSDVSGDRHPNQVPLPLDRGGRP